MISVGGLPSLDIATTSAALIDGTVTLAHPAQSRITEKASVLIVLCYSFPMSGNSFGTLYCVTSFGESHGPAYGGVVDGCPPGLELKNEDLQKELDRRKPGSSRHV